MTTDDWSWLDSTAELQRVIYGFDPRTATMQEFADYVTWNMAALHAEVGEFSREVGWKPWAAPRGWVERERALDELVDVGHFLANLLNALQVTDDEWVEAYRRKQEVNRQRQRDGYDGRGCVIP